MHRTWTAAAAAAITGVTLAVAPAAPAAAYSPDGTATSAGVVEIGWSSLDFYLNRPLTQELTALVRRHDKSSGAPTAFLQAAACLRLRHPLAAGLCATVATLAGSVLLDELLEADRIGGCLRISMTWIGPGVSAYNDDGRYCVGERA